MSMSAGLSGSEQAMPILIVNMGGEMLYILEQRLQAQAIVEEKSLRGQIPCPSTIVALPILDC